jgi:hypothetical protein
MSGRERMFSGRTFRPHLLFEEAISFSEVKFLQPRVRGMPGLTSSLSLSTTGSSLAVVECSPATVKWEGGGALVVLGRHGL